MHDRRIDGDTFTFGNEGALFMNAMTWWDWETNSIWSQPWGAAIDGELAGTRLTLLPFELVPWSSWIARHPESKVLVDERGDFEYRGRIPVDQFVIGISIGEAAKAFYFASSANAGVVNDFVGEFPVAVFVDSSTRVIDAYFRRAHRSEQVDNNPNASSELLTFTPAGSEKSTGANLYRDEQTGSTWDIVRGVAIEGSMKGAILQRAPFVSAYDWAWGDFNPHSEFWGDQLDEMNSE